MRKILRINMKKTADEDKLENLKALEQAHDYLQHLAFKKREIESIPDYEPGKNYKRKFINSAVDTNISLVDFDKTTARKPPQTDGAHEKRFEPFE